MSDSIAVCPDCPGPRARRRGLANRSFFAALVRRLFGRTPAGDTVPNALPDAIMAAPADAEAPVCEIPLGRLGIGDQGRVCGFAAGGRGYRRKLLAMGMTPGVEFQVLRVAPLGDPVEVRVRGSHLSLRKDEAATLKVERLGRGPGLGLGPGRGLGAGPGAGRGPGRGLGRGHRHRGGQP